jgi:D-glycero-alpha-D-manno-heptose 1-phosphate guanylyltransferase
LAETSQSFEILVLAGGLGTRLRSLVSDVPKPMAPVEGRPFLSWVLDYWLKQSPRRIVISVGYLGHAIKDYFGEDYHGCPVAYVTESSPLGTGGAVRLALAEGGFGKTPVLLINGDTWFRGDIRQLQDIALDDFHLTMMLKHLDVNDRYGRVLLDAERRVIDFQKFQEGPGYINVGCYLLNPQKMREYLGFFDARFSFEDQVLVPLAKTGKIAASLQDGPFIDIGIPADYKKCGAVLRG